MLELLSEQIKLEKEMIDTSGKNYSERFENSIKSGAFGCTSTASRLISEILDNFAKCIRIYIQNKPMTIASVVIRRIDDIDSVAFITAKTILNSVWSETSSQDVYKSIGQALECEYKMRKFRIENSHYYNSIQNDLNKYGTKTTKRKTVTSKAFEKKLDFHIEKWQAAEKFQTGLVLTNIFVKVSKLVKFEDIYQKNKHIKQLVPTNFLLKKTDNLNEYLKVMQPLYLPMVYKPKKWTTPLDGGYISPFMRRNKLIKNNDKIYLKKLAVTNMPVVYEAINHLQETEWQINKQVLEVMIELAKEGNTAGLPSNEDIISIPYPDTENLQSKEVIQKWKRDNFEVRHKNIQNRSLRLLVSQILHIALKFKDYDRIWFPYQMDFRGRMYPIPVFLNPQGSDISKSLLRFAQSKPVDNNSVKWLKIHGANLYGYDKESYEERIKWIESRHNEIQSYAENPLENRGWTRADKPFQFLAFCFEYSDYLSDSTNFRTHLPILLDGTCNGLQHYSALLRDYKGGCAVNLVNSPKPCDIYSTVAETLKEKLINISTCEKSAKEDKQLARCWLELGINRKLTKRPVMVLPYGGTVLSCREYITEYLKDNYSNDFLFKHFQVCENPSQCLFKISVWLGAYLWKSIQETLHFATEGMGYLRHTAGIATKKNKPLEWNTPVGLPVKQAYKSRKRKEIKTELYGSILKTNINTDTDILDKKRQLNGICPNFIHSLDAACLMLYIVKCKKAGIKSFMTIHDCYGTLASDTDISAKLLREAFVEIYKQPVLENFTNDILKDETEIPDMPPKGSLNIEDVLKSNYFFN